MQKIKNKNFVVCPAVCTKGNIELLHVDEFPKTGSHFSGYIPEEASLRNSFDKDTHFFYTIEKFDSTDTNSRKITHAERGLAHIEKNRKKFTLKRDVCIESVQRDDDLPTENSFITFEEGTYLVIGSYIPKNYIDLLIEEHSVICSIEASSPSPVQINQSSVLGRLDGDIQSLGRKELGLILTPDYTVSSLKASSSPLLLSSEYIEVLSDKSALSCAHFIARPSDSRPKNREQGSLIFNKNKKCLEYFNGSKWIEVK